MKAHKYGDNVDTDVIIPARHLNTSDPDELAAHCMEDIIFYRNALNIGLPILECPAAAKAISAGDDVSVELAAGEIADLTTGQRFRAEPFPPFMMELIAAGGLSAYLKGKIK